MPTRELPSLTDSCLQRDIRIHQDSTDTGPPDSGIDLSQSFSTPARTLSPVSATNMNMMNSARNMPTSPITPQTLLNAANGTIRTVPPELLHLTNASRKDFERITQSRTEPIVALHPSRNLPTISTASSLPPLTRQNSGPSGNGIVRQISSEFGPTRSYSNNNLQIFEERTLSPDGSNSSFSPGPASGGTWSSAIGKANLGKSGRVIERLMGENDMLKRDLKIERLRAEDYQQSVKMVEARLETLQADYDSRLHETTVSKTLLKRRERQVAELKAQLENEHVRAEAAVESERGWREAMERGAEESKRLVDEAQNFAALMEGRNNAMTGHWKDQGAEVDRTMKKLKQEIEAIALQRKLDDARMATLQSLCDQQAEQLEALREEKGAIAMKHEEYRIEQEEALKDIKQRARQQEVENERTIKETKKALGELRWALNVKASLREENQDRRETNSNSNP